MDCKPLTVCVSSVKATCVTSSAELGVHGVATEPRSSFSLLTWIDNCGVLLSCVTTQPPTHQVDELMVNVTETDCSAPG